jgi:dihydropyrimidinase
MADYTPYEGRPFTGWQVMILSRGEVVWAEGQVGARPSRGAFVARERSPLAAPGRVGSRA